MFSIKIESCFNLPHAQVAARTAGVSQVQLARQAQLAKAVELGFNEKCARALFTGEGFFEALKYQDKEYVNRMRYDVYKAMGYYG